MPYRQPEQREYLSHLIRSFRQLTGGELVSSGLSPEAQAEALYHAPFALLSHDRQPDPVFCYANLTAQRLWAMDWAQFCRTPSRLSARPDAREARQALLAKAAAQGYVDDYAGIRVTSQGKLFRITGCTLWNVLDAHGATIGQAAQFARWQWLDEPVKGMGQ